MKKILVVLLGIGCGSDIPAAGTGRYGEPVWTVPDSPTCPECSIRAATVAQLGAPDDPSSIHDASSGIGCIAAPLADSQWVVSMVVGGGELAVYDSAGRQTRTIGRPGKGPFEFSSFLQVAAAADGKVHVVDPLNSRRTILSSSGELESEIPLPALIESFVLLDDGSMLVQLPRRRDMQAGAALFQHVAPDGTDMSEFGRPPENPNGWPDRWTLAVGSDGTVWSGAMLSYELTQWSQSGEALRTLVASREWVTNLEEVTPSPDQPIPTMLLHARAADDGLIWLFFGVPTDPGSAGGEGRVTASGVNQLLDTRVEIINPDKAELVARADFDEVLMPVCGTDYVYAVENTADGDTRMRISRLRLD